MPQFFTRTGDNGYTGLLGEGRVPKYDPRMEAVGTIDEASSALGLARAVCQAETSRETLLAVQRDLYNLMAEVAATPENAARFHTIDATRVNWLETQVSTISETVAIPNEFIVPGDSLPGAALDMARTIVRRAERQVVYLIHHEELENDALIHYLNRLSSLCFVLELLENQLAGKSSPTFAKTL
jgi:cob(I)alamin adenosyltransferase